MRVSTDLGSSASLPCSLSSPQTGDRARLVLWFREEEPTRPIYSVDLRERSLAEARHWSDDNSLQGRAYFQGDSSPGRLVVEGVQAKDGGVFRCRVDFKIQPTIISRVKLTVNMPPEKPVITDSAGQEVRLKLGPYSLGQGLMVQCSVLGGSPRPRVTWWRDHQIVDSSSQTEEVSGGARGTNLLTLPALTRGDLGSILTCQVMGHQTCPGL